MRQELPTGRVTFLFTDIEGSTGLLEEVGAERYGALLARSLRSRATPATSNEPGCSPERLTACAPSGDARGAARIGYPASCRRLRAPRDGNMSFEDAQAYALAIVD